MRLTHAMTLRDGGTTSITVAQGVVTRLSYTIDHQLPWDGRTRYVFKGPPFLKDKEHRMEIGCDEEKEIQRWLNEIGRRKYGSMAIEKFLAGQAKNPGRGKWFYAMNFLWILAKERREQDGPANANPMQR